MNGIQDCQKLESALNANQHIGTEKENEAITKTCTKCGHKRLLQEFYIRKSGFIEVCCKKCIINRAKAYVIANPKKIKAARKAHYIANKEKVRNNSKSYYKANKRKYINSAKALKAANPEKNSAYYKEYSKQNRKRLAAYGKKWMAKRRKNSPKYRLNGSVSIGIYTSLKKNKHGYCWETLVGYSLNVLTKHLEKQFTEGMSWDNYGREGWTLDHKIPVSVFNFTKPDHIDFKRCWALENLQPMWHKDNIKKNNTIEKPFQPSLLL